MGVGNRSGGNWVRNRGHMHRNQPKDRTKAKAQPRLKGYKKRKK